MTTAALILEAPVAAHSRDETSPTSTAATKAVRSDGIEARNRLMDAALMLFAEKGFAKTSIREIAQVAHVNVAAISYYFGDKASLYRAVFMDPRSNPKASGELLTTADAGIQAVLQGFLRGLLEPIKQGHCVAQCMKLHFREMLEPTGVWAEEIDNNIKPKHAALVLALCRHLGAEQDDDIHRLAFSLAGLGITMHITGDVMAAIRPELLATPEAVDGYCDRLVGFGMAMVNAEAERRAQVAHDTKAESPTISNLSTTT